MPLNKNALETAFKEALDFDSDKEVNPAEARARLAKKMADAVDAFVQSGDVKTTVTGTSATGGPVTGTGTGKIQ